MRGDHARHHEAAVSQPDALANHIAVGKKFTRQRAAQHDLRTALRAMGEKAALRQAHMADRQQLGRAAEHGDFAQAPASRELGYPHIERRQPPHLRQLADKAGVFQGQVARRLAQRCTDKSTRGFGATRQNDDQVGAK